MRYLTEEEIKELEQYNIVKHFQTAINDKYIVGVKRKEVEIVTNVFKKANNDENTLYNWNCNVCAIKNFRQVGKHYYASIEKLKEEQEQQQIEQHNTSIEQEENNTSNNTMKDGNNNTKKKKGRPSKKDKNTK